MRPLLSALVAVSTAALAIFGADTVFRRSATAKKMRAENLYIAKSDAFSKSPGADIGITGDSRILHGLNPTSIEQVIRRGRSESLSVYNAGLSGAPPMAQLAWVRRFLTAKKPPRLVLMSISPYMFSSKIVYSASRESLTTMYRFRDLPALFRAAASAEDFFTVFSVNAFEAVRHRPRILEVLLKDSKVGPGANIGIKGFIENGEATPSEQDARARGRGVAYRTEMWRPEAKFGNEQMAYFREALRELREKSIRTIVLNSPSSSQIELAYGPNSIYDEHIAWVRKTAGEFHASYVDAKQSPVLRDVDFVDGDHLSGRGAAQFSEWLAKEVIVPALAGR